MIRKRPEPFIIPSVFFRPRSLKTEKKTEKPLAEPQKTTDFKAPPPTGKRVASSTSLSGFRLQKNHKQDHSEEQSGPQKPSIPFSRQQLEAAWHALVKDIEQKGLERMAALMEHHPPTLEGDHKLRLTLPSESSKDEFNLHKTEILAFLRAQLNNHQIDTVIDIRKADLPQEAYIFSGKDKYEKLLSLNPHLELLVKTFKINHLN